ncbi:hypothetical protein C8R44DRAFT_731420 [Mycena epipterygia]|nr:hypothetical protein C8R44DRAFT_731420 [Mycena epipterygia]
MPAKVVILAQFDYGYYIRGTLKKLTGVLPWVNAWWICTRNPRHCCLAREEMPAKVVNFGSVWPRILYPWDFEEADRCCGLAPGLVDPWEMPAKVVILAQFDYGYYIRGTLKKLTGVLPWVNAWWICTRNPRHCCLAREEMPAKVVNFGSVWPRILYPWDFEEADRCCGLAPGLVDPWEMPAKVVILAQFDYGYYIHGTLKRLMGFLAWLKAWWIFFDYGYYIRGTLKKLTGVLPWVNAWWICTRNPRHCCLAREEMPAKVVNFGSVWPRILYPWDFEEADRCCGLAPGLVDPWEMPAKVVILAQFDYGYYIHGTLKRLMGFLAWLKAWWIFFDYGYYIRGTLKKLTGVLPWVNAWWICTRNPRHCCLAREEMPAKVVNFGSVWPRILYPWDFEEADRCCGLAPGLVDPCECETSHRLNIHATVASPERKCLQKLWFWQFGHGYYIRGTLRRLAGVLAWLQALWICVSVKQVTDQISMPLLPRRRGNACKSRDFGSVWPRILYPWDFEEADRCCDLAPGLVDPFWPRILYPWDFEEAGRCFGLAPGFVDLCERETGHRPDIHATVASPERKCSQKL